MANRELPDTKETFIDWVFKEKGYLIEASSKDGEPAFKLIGKQEQLF